MTITVDKNRLFIEDIQQMDQEVRSIVYLIQDGLPEVASELYMKTVCLDHKYDMIHPVDRITDYRVFAGKIAGEISRLENITSNIRRRVENLSQTAREVLIHHLGQGVQDQEGVK